MDSIPVEGREAVVFFIFSLGLCTAEHGWWLLFPVLDLVIGLFNMFSGILSPPHCQFYIICYFILNLFLHPQVLDVGWILKLLKCISNLQPNKGRDMYC